MLKELAAAIRQSDNLLIENLLKDQQLDVNGFVSTEKITVDREVTPLHIAASWGNINALGLLLTHPKINIESITKFHNTPFHIAVNYGRFEACKELLPVANILAKNKVNRTAYDIAKRNTADPTLKAESEKICDLLRIPTFVRACEEGDLPVVKKMVEDENVDVNALYGKENKPNYTGLQAACSRAQVEVVSYLLNLKGNKKVELHKTNNRGLTAYDEAKRNIVGPKLKAEAEKICDLLRVPTFVEACAEGDLRIVKKMVEEEKVDINAFHRKNNATKYTGLQAACNKVQTEVVNYLLKLQRNTAVDLVIRNNECCTAYDEAKKNITAPKLQAEAQKICDLLRVPTFVQACAQNDPGVVKKMVEVEEVDVNALDGQYDDDQANYTGLQAACFNHQYETVLYLLTLKGNKKVDLDKRNNKGSTALHYVCLQNVAKDPEAIRTKVDCNEFQGIRFYENGKIQKYLMDEQAIRVFIANRLLVAGAKVDPYNYIEGCTPLHLAVMSNQLVMVKLLTLRGADMTLPLKCHDPSMIEVTKQNKVYDICAVAQNFRPEIYKFLSDFKTGKFQSNTPDVIEKIVGGTMELERLLPHMCWFKELHATNQNPVPPHDQNDQPTPTV